ncbi:MAG: hypothetical protein WCJ13_01615 [Coriobacteriia bacterium]
MTQEQYGAALGQLAVTVVMTWLTHTVLALFLAAWLAVVGGVIYFSVAALRLRAFAKRTELTSEREREAGTLIRRGWLGVLGCAATFVCYLPMSWATTYYYDAISQGLVAYSPTCWIVWSLTMLWYASIPLGIAGTVAAWSNGIRLRRLMNDDPSSGTAVAANPLLGEGD